MSMPKEPRQLMINLMYLVLTALLALNVSSEILHAFKVINQSVTSSNAAIVDKNKQVYDAFDENERQKGQEERIKPFNDKAKLIRKEAEAAVALLEEWKNKVVERAGGRDKETGEIEKEDDIDASTDLLVEADGGDQIKKTLVDLRAKMLSVVGDPAAKTSLEKTLPIRVEDPEKSENNPRGDWSFGYFHNMPTVAAVTLLAKFQNDIRNSEAAVINQLIAEAGNIQVKFDEMAAIAVPKNSYALVGQKVEASIMLAAYNKAVQPQVVSSGGGGRITKVENGVAIWETTASGAGLQTVKGTVSIDLGGRLEQRPYEFQYMVGSTGASLQLDKMNVMYIGVPNPVTVTAAGYSLQDVSLVMEDANITKTSDGHYEVSVDKIGAKTAKIIAKTATGTTEVGTMPIRVKFIPDPKAIIGKRSSGSLPISEFRAQVGIAAVLENFDFEAKYIVQSYEFSMLPKRGDLIGPYKVTGYKLSGNSSMEDALKRAKPGDKLFFDDIVAIGPDKRKRSLNSVIFTLL